MHKLSTPPPPPRVERSSPLIRLAEHLTALRAWFTRYLPGRESPLYSAVVTLGVARFVSNVSDVLTD